MDDRRRAERRNRIAELSDEAANLQQANIPSVNEGDGAWAGGPFKRGAAVAGPANQFLDQIALTFNGAFFIAATWPRLSPGCGRFDNEKTTSTGTECPTSHTFAASGLPALP
jgi:hypothetical protein